MKKLIAMVLVLFMLCSVLAACGTKNETPTDKTPDNNGNGTTDNPGKTDEPDDTGIVVRDFGGADYTVLYNDLPETEVGVYEFNGSFAGDLVRSSVSERNYTVENKFGVRLNLIPKKGGWGERKDFTAAVRAEKFSNGTDGFDLIATHSVYLGWMGIEGLGKDLSDYPEYIDFSKPWWSQNMYDELNLKGHLFMMLGDIAYSLYSYIQVMFVNETQFENYFSEQGGVDMLYDLVDAGEWTWDRLWEFADSFGEGPADGKYGIRTNTHSWRASFISQDAHLFERDYSDGRLTLKNALGAKEVAIVEKMTENYAKDNMEVAGTWDTHAPQYNPEFLAGNILFYPQTLGEAKTLFADASEEYGIVPLPKYDVDQEMYKTQCRDSVTAVMIMCSTKDDERTAIVTEGMAYYGHEIIVPVYYQQSLVTRYVEKYTDILDTIRAGLTYQAGDAYLQSNEGDLPSMRFDTFLNPVLNGNVQASTKYAGNLSVAQNELRTFYSRIEKLGIKY